MNTLQKHMMVSAITLLTAFSAASAHEPAGGGQLHRASLGCAFTGLYTEVSAISVLAEIVRNDGSDPKIAAGIADKYQRAAACSVKFLEAMQQSGELTQRESDSVALMVSLGNATSQAAAHLKAYIDSDEPQEGTACDDSLATALQLLQQINDLQSRQ